MADTIRGTFPGQHCNDCNGEGVCVQHSGPLVPLSTTGFFCQACITARDAEWRAGYEPRELGTQPRVLS